MGGIPRQIQKPQPQSFGLAKLPGEDDWDKEMAFEQKVAKAAFPPRPPDDAIDEQ